MSFWPSVKCRSVDVSKRFKDDTSSQAILKINVRDKKSPDISNCTFCPPYKVTEATRPVVYFQVSRLSYEAK